VAETAGKPSKLPTRTWSPADGGPLYLQGEFLIPSILSTADILSGVCNKAKSPKYAGEEALLPLRIDLVLHIPRRFLVLLLVRQLVCADVILLRPLELSQLAESISQPSERHHLFAVQFSSFFETGKCVLELSQPEEGGSLIVIVYRVFGLQFDSLVVTLDCFLVVLQFVVGCSQVAMVSWYFPIDVDGLLSEFNLLLEVAQLTDCLAFEVKEVAAFCVIG
jgi:hypothetical protein